MTDFQHFQPTYCKDRPTDQTAIDIFKGLWKSAFPPETGVLAGYVPNFHDSRVAWMDEHVDFRGRSVLELGPFEAYNTFQISRLGTKSITAIEGNNINYLKCLVAKEVLGIDARFLHGDVGRFLRSTSERYDICWAAGVLYHQEEPLVLLDSIGRVCECVFLWTHFYDDRMAGSAQYPHFNADYDEFRSHRGYRCRHYYRSYKMEGGPPALFSGGSNDFAYWLSKDDILNYLQVLGFTTTTICSMNMTHTAGPTLSFLATKPTFEYPNRG